MKIKRQTSVVRAVAKNIAKKEKADPRNSPKANEFYRILNQKGPLDDLQSSNLTAKEMATVTWFITECMNLPIGFYPNLGKS